MATRPGNFRKEQDTVLTRARDWWMNLGRNNQIILGASSLGVLIALLGFISWASTPEFVPLFSNLSAQDAAAIVDKLKEAKVPYHTTQNSTAIEVPAQNRDELRLKMINQGLPQGDKATPGDDLKSLGPMSTGPVERESLLRMRENEISRSVMSLEQVSSAIVQISPADDSPFASQKSVAKASVMIGVKPGQTLDDGNVRAIVRLTQMSYPGLNENSISVANTRGELLHDPQSLGLGNSSDRLKQQTAVERQKHDLLQSVLDRTLGPDKAYVIVNAELSNDKKNTEETLVSPGAVTSSDVAVDKVTGAGASAPTGVPGAASNIANATPTYDAKAAGTPGAANTEHTSKVILPSVTKTMTEQGAGKIEKLTVSAMVDKSVPAEQIDAIKTTLLNAIGGTADSKERLVTVTQVAFDRTAADKALKESEAAAASERMSKTLGLVVPLALMVAFFLMLARAFKRTQQAAQLASGGGQLALAGAGGMGAGGIYALPDGTLAQVALDEDGNPLPGQMVDTLLSPEARMMGISSGNDDPHTYAIIEQAFDSQMESIQHLIKTKPEVVAALLKSWTVDE